MVYWLVIIWALTFEILAFWSDIYNLISASLSCIGYRVSSVILSSLTILSFDYRYCFYQYWSSLFMLSISSFINSRLFPNGLAFWQMDWTSFVRVSMLSLLPAVDWVICPPAAYFRSDTPDLSGSLCLSIPFFFFLPSLFILIPPSSGWFYSG